MLTKKEQIEAIREEILALKGSPLFAYRTENGYFPVIGEGSCEARIMLIGEAPGRNEAKTGRPFCGTAGKVLDRLLDSIDLKRDSIYITNIVKDRPPENRDPTSEEIRVYGPFLDRQIEIIRPRAIVALGRYAMAYIMERFGLKGQIEPIGKAHGKSYKAESSYGNIDVIALYHPCVAVYNPNNIVSLLDDFKILEKYVDRLSA